MCVRFGLYLHFVIIQAEDIEAEVKPFLNMLTALFIYHYYSNQIRSSSHVLPYSHGLGGLHHAPFKKKKKKRFNAWLLNLK